ncbi:MAG: ROK family protein [Roseiflexaceae bacterium]
MALYGGIEAGGTKWVCVVGTEPGALQAEITFPTTTPGATIGQAIAFFRAHGDLAAIGIGSFGPVDVHPASPTWGFITTTPKPGWQHIDLGQAIRGALGVPLGFDTDVNAAALGEQRWGAAQGIDTFVYLTIGTGIGGGAMVNGRLLHGLLHPEMGHMRIPHERARDPFAGVCPYHGDCLEGLAAGPAIAARWEQRGETLTPDHPAWPLEAHYLALALVNLICTLSPRRIILGGGVMSQPHLFPLVRRAVGELLGGYIQAPAITETIDAYIVPPSLGRYAGVAGALVLAQQAAGTI